MVILDKEEFQRWRGHPLTVEFLALLSRRRTELMEAWGRGLRLAPEQQAQAVLLGRLAEVNFNDIRDFVDLPPLEDTEEETDTNGGRNAR